MAKVLTEDEVRSASPATSPSCRRYSAEANCVGFGPALFLVRHAGHLAVALAALALAGCESFFLFDAGVGF